VALEVTVATAVAAPSEGRPARGIAAGARTLVRAAALPVSATAALAPPTTTLATTLPAPTAVLTPASATALSATPALTTAPTLAATLPAALATSAALAVALPAAFGPALVPFGGGDDEAPCLPAGTPRRDRRAETEREHQDQRESSSHQDISSRARCSITEPRGR
jgi:hypothetical protein